MEFSIILGAAPSVTAMAGPLFLYRIFLWIRGFENAPETRIASAFCVNSDFSMSGEDAWQWTAVLALAIRTYATLFSLSLTPENEIPGQSLPLAASKRMI